MRVSVNLATRPFVELRPFFLRLRLTMAALAIAGVALVVTAHVLSNRAAKQQAELDQLRDQTIAAQQARIRTEQRMRQPGNAAVLDRAHFLNRIFLQKSFSWTAVMMDLENVLPTGVQVTSIEPAVASSGDVVIRLRVAGDRDRAVQLVRNLERSRRFLQPRLVGEASQARENTAAGGPRPNAVAPGGPGAAGVPTAPPGVEFEILADYNPLPPGESYVTGHHQHGAAPGPSAAIRWASPRSPRNAATSGSSPAANLQRGYPRDGVTLQPYNGPVPGNAPPGQPRTAVQGGPR